MVDRAPEPPALPAEMVGAYVTFLKTLSDHHQITVSPARYLRLCLDAKDAKVRYLQPPHRARILLQIGTRTVYCVYDCRGAVLLKALPDEHPCHEQERRLPSAPKRQEGWTHPNGTRRKKMHRVKRPPRKGREERE